MKRAKTGVLRRRRIGDRASFLDELHREFGVQDRFAAWQAAPRPAAQEDSAELAFFRAFTFALLERFVPALRPPGTSGRPRKKVGVTLDEYLALGGSLLGYDEAAVARDAQARFAAAIDRLQAGKAQSRSWVFRWLADPRHPRRRQALPSPWSELTSAASLQRAYSKLPKAVRDDPAAHFLRSGR